MERARSRVHRDGMAHADVSGEGLFERLDFAAEHELAAVEHAPDRGLNLVRQPVVLRFQIEIRNHTGHPSASSSTTRPRSAIEKLAASSRRTTLTPERPS